MIAGTVSSKWAKGSGGSAGDECQNLVAHSLRGEGFDASEDGTGRGMPIIGVTQNSNPDVFYEVSPTLKVGTGLDISQPPCIAIQERAVCENPDAGPQGKGWQEGAAFTLEARAKVQAVAFAQNTRDEVRLFSGDGSVAGALAAEPGMKQQTFVATHDVAGTMVSAKSGGGRSNSVDHATAGLMALDAQTGAVRRLTPLECERLQGFPDGWTAVPGASDSACYKALGNSMAVNVMRAIGARIAMFEELKAAGAFDLPPRGGGQTAQRSGEGEFVNSLSARQVPMLKHYVPGAFIAESNERGGGAG